MDMTQIYIYILFSFPGVVVAKSKYWQTTVNEIVAVEYETASEQQYQYGKEKC